MAEPDRLTIESACQSGRPNQTRPMSGFTPRTPDDEPSGLQDVLAFIADFEMDDNASSSNHSGEEWEDVMATEQPIRGKVYDANLEDLFTGGGRPATPSAAVSSCNTTSSGQSILLPINALAVPSTLPQAIKLDGDGGALKTTRRHRVTRKEELEYLRKKVTDMEDKLKTLKTNSVGGSPPPPPAPSTAESEQAAMQLKQSIALWKKMAERQKNQRESVESENAKLREKLKTQVRMAKSLQRILRKRERAAEQITTEAPKRLRQLPHDVQTVVSGDEFNELVQNLDMLYTMTNERISLSPTASGSQPAVREQDVKYNDLTGMFIEFQSSKLLPFDLATVARAIWRHASEPGIKFNTYFDEVAETSENMILRKFGVEIKQDDRVAKLSGRQAIRRYEEANRLVIVRNSIIDRVELSGTATGGLTFRDAGWVVLRDVTGQYSTYGSMTMLHSYATMTPDVDLDSQWEIGALTDFVLQSRGDIEVGNDNILENLLLEEESKGKKSLNMRDKPAPYAKNAPAPDLRIWAVRDSIWTSTHSHPENVTMSIEIRQEPFDNDDLLTFVSDFGLGDGTEMVHCLEEPEYAWLDDLEVLFKQTGPVLKPTLEPLNDEAVARTAAAPVTIVAKKSSGRPRVSRKEELEYLRMKVKEMERKLHQLKETSDERALTSAPSNLHDEQIQQNQYSIDLWKRLAERQRNQRDSVELENSKLREKLKAQVRMAKSLKRILCKRTRDEDQVAIVIPKRLRPAITASSFEEMLQCMGELYIATDTHIAHTPTASFFKPAIRKRDIQCSAADGIFLEFHDSKLLPFDLPTADRTMWRFLTETGVRFNNYIEEHVEMRDNTMLRSFGVELKHDGRVAVVFGRQVIRRHVESDRVVLVRHSIIDEIRLAGAPSGGLTFRETGWIVLKKSLVVPGMGAATLTQGYSTMSPDIDLDAQWEIGALTDFVLQSREDIEVGNDTIIESMLLDESTKQAS